MKKKINAVIAIIILLIASFLFGTGYMKNPNVALVDYSVSEDGSKITLHVGVATSMGYIRTFKDDGSGVKPHYLTFYSTFGGLNSPLGAKNTFTLQLAPEDTEIYFNRADGGYELVLVKDTETGQWIRPTEINNQQEKKVSEEIITYNGKEYKKSGLCDATLQWLNLSEQERMLSSYFPPEFTVFNEKWGIILTAENVTPTSVTIKCTQFGGEPTGELQTGSWYILETWTQEKGWHVDACYAEVSWTEEAWLISKDNVTEWEVNWEWLYGTLSKGKYRIGKEIIDFRDVGDYDTQIYFAEFEITE